LATQIKTQKSISISLNGLTLKISRHFLIDYALLRMGAEAAEFDQ
jgi:hypothetical protein